MHTPVKKSPAVEPLGKLKVFMRGRLPAVGHLVSSLIVAVT